MIQNPHILPSQELLIELLDLDQDTGTLTWKRRHRCHFSTDNACNSWNAKWAGKEAFTALDGKGYRVGAVFYRLHRAHRLIWLMVNGEWPESIDHIDGDRTNNSITNLRSVSHQENMRNQTLRRTSKTGITGVCWSPRDHKWRAHIKDGGRQVWLGEFHSKEAAAKARKKAEKKYGYHKNHGTIR